MAEPGDRVASIPRDPARLDAAACGRVAAVHRALLMELFDRARGMERIVARGGTLDYQNRILATLFYEPSTRTRFCFEAAMHRLGGRVLSTEHARAFSSEIEGEQVEDSIRIMGSYCDVIVIRHHQEGGPQRAAKVSPVRSSTREMAMAGSILRRRLLDLYTIYRERPLDGLSVAFIGELDQGRTAGRWPICWRSSTASRYTSSARRNCR